MTATLSAPATHPTPTATAVIYARVSRDREGAGLAVERQEADCRELAARLGLTVVELYADNDISAYSGRARPDYLRMFTDLDRPGAPSVVLCWHNDRLHRSTLELERWITLAERRGIVVQTVRAGEIDLATPSGRAVAKTIGAWAQQESEHKSDRIKRKMVEIRGEGRWHGGPVPFGWRRVPPAPGKGHGTLEVDRAQAALIIEGTEVLLGGGSLRQIVRAWEASGVRPTRGGHWQAITVRSVLTRWRNAAVLEHRGLPTGPADWPPISVDGATITAEQVRAVRELFAARSAAAADYSNRSAHLLSGIATCGGCGTDLAPDEVCGAPLRAARSGGIPVYRCTVRGGGHVVRAATPLDKLVRDLIARRLAMPDLSDLLPSTEQVDVAALHAAVARETGKLDTFAVMLADGDLTPAEHRVSTARVRDRLLAAEAALSGAVRRSPIAPLLRAPDPTAAFLAADLDMQRAAVRELVTVSVLPTRPGTPPGGGLDLDAVDVQWRKAGTG